MISLSSTVSLWQRYSHLHELLDNIACSVENARLQAKDHIFNDNTTKMNVSVEEIRSIRAATDENYFSTVSNLSHVTLLRFRATADEFTRVMIVKNFTAVANNCSLTTIRNPGQISTPDPECREDLKSLLHVRDFSPTVLAQTMPAGKLVVEDNRYVLTYLHIIHDAVVGSDGDVYSHNVRIVPWRCKWYRRPLSYAERQALHVYDEVSALKTKAIHSIRYCSNANVWQWPAWLSQISKSSHPMMTSSWKHFPRYWHFVRGIHRSRWIPRTKASDAELWCFLWSTPE